MKEQVIVQSLNSSDWEKKASFRPKGRCFLDKWIEQNSISMVLLEFCIANGTSAVNVLRINSNLQFNIVFQLDRN